MKRAKPLCTFSFSAEEPAAFREILSALTGDRERIAPEELRNLRDRLRVRHA
jgi:hypothetical protein